MRPVVSAASLCTALSCPAAAAPPAKKPPAPKPAPAVASRPKEPSPVISTGKEAILVAHLQPERPTVVLFFQPTKAEDNDLLELAQDRVKKDPRVALRLVRLASLETPIARQYEITATPLAFVYDRNKNLLGKGARIDELEPLVGSALRTGRIKWVDERDEKATEVYRRFGGGRYPVPEIMKTMSLQPEAMEMISEIAGRFHFRDTYLPRRTKEMIASYVSALNKCRY